MRMMLLLAGTRDEVRHMNGGTVNGRPYNLSPLYVCTEYQGYVMGVPVQKFPPLGEVLPSHFNVSRELNQELEEELVSALDAALATAAQTQDSTLSARWTAATPLTPDSLKKWIASNRGKWVAQAWA